ncbi:MAG TPA: LptF/LptG family permease, partial [Anaeromyxobacteraceae bacterium]
LLGQAEVLLGSGVSALDLGVVVAALTPHFLGYVLPVAFLLGGVLGVGRLTEDRELVALGAAGISPLRLVKVPLLIGLAVSAVALWLTLDVEPRGLKAARARVDQIVKKNVSSEVRSGVFYEDIPALTLYAEQARAGGWRHVLIEDRSDSRAPVLALAQAGRLEPAGPGDEMRLVLTGGELHREEPAGEYLVARFDGATVAVGLGSTLDVEPRGLKAARARIDQIVKKNVSSEVRSGVFYEEIPTLTLYAEQARAGRWRHVLLEDRSDPRAPVLALAQGGRLEPAGPGDAMRLVLESGELHREERAGDYLVGRFAEASVSVGLGSALGEKNRLGGSAFELTTGEIAALAHGARDLEEARYWRSFLFRRLAGPVGILAFALLCVPIAAARRGGRAFGYGATLLAMVVYYAVMRFGEGLSQGGALPPWLGPNLANAVFALAGGLALWGIHRKGPGAVR